MQHRLEDRGGDLELLTVKYNGIRLRPIARNIIRAIGLYLDFRVEISIGEDDGIYFYTEKQKAELHVDSDFFEVIAEEVKESYVNSDNARGGNLSTLYQTMGTLIENREILEEKKILIEFIAYVVRCTSDFRLQNNEVPTGSLYEKWNRYYGELSDFHIRSNRKINHINLSEAAVYRDIFEKTKTGVTSIDHAVDTLLDTLPDDAEKILDIGAGPGYVNKSISSDYHVLAMDIEEKILNENIRPTCVGDVTDIPLENQSVDMVMACDVLEHVPTELLSKAIEEIKRVAKKYIYIQVPYKENLADSMAECGQCGYVWHVNFHKNTFDYTNLVEILGTEWKSVRVNFTGDVSYYGDRNNTECFQMLGIDYKLVENWKCPKCGGNSTVNNGTDYELMNNIFAVQSSVSSNLPKYTELGMLFCKVENDTGYRKEDNSQRFEKTEMNTMNIDLSQKLAKTNIFSRHEMIPMYLTSELVVLENKHGYVVENPGKENAWIAFIIPGKCDAVTFRGKAVTESSISISSIDIEGKEFVIKEEELGPGEFEETAQFPEMLVLRPVLVKLYLKRGSMELNRLVCDGEARAYIRYQSVQGEKHLKKVIGDQLFSWYIPEAGFIDMDESEELWMGRQEVMQSGTGKILLDYISRLQTAFLNTVRALDIETCTKVQEQEQQKNSCSIKDLEALQEKDKINQSIIAMLQEKIGELEEKTEKTNSYIIATLEEIVREQKNEIQIQKNFRFELENKLMERQKHVLPYIKSKCYLVIGKSIRVTKRIIRKLPFLYKMLVKMGIKKKYNQIKGKIKSGEKYE